MNYSRLVCFGLAWLWAIIIFHNLTLFLLPQFFKVNGVYIHLAYLSSSIFKPEGCTSYIYVKSVLLSVAFEKFSLCDDVVLNFFLFFFVDKVTFTSLVAGLGHIRRHTDKVWIATRSSIWRSWIKFILNSIYNHWLLLGVYRSHIARGRASSNLKLLLLTSPNICITNRWRSPIQSR